MLEAEITSFHGSADDPYAMNSTLQAKSGHTRLHLLQGQDFNYINNTLNMTYHNGTANILEKWC